MDVTINVVNVTAITVSWQYLVQINVPKQYEVYLQTKPSSAFILPFYADSNTRLITRLHPNTNYTISVKICSEKEKWNCKDWKEQQLNRGLKMTCKSNYGFI